MTTAIFWFTLDLRLQDNPGLAAALQQHKQVIPLFILDHDDPWFFGSASQWWLHHSLKALQQTIAAQGGKLLLRHGKTADILHELAKQTGSTAIYFSRAYEPWLATKQQEIFHAFDAEGIHCKRYSGRLLQEPDSILNQQGKPFQVFTPFYKHCLKHLHIPANPPPTKPSWYKRSLQSKNLSDWHLLPTKPNWAKGFSPWLPGETGAQLALQDLVDDKLAHYSTGRDFPAQDGTSRLSPHLHFGEISPRKVWHELSRFRTTAEPFLRQLMWREFSFYLLHHWPHITDKPFKPAFANFPWKKQPRFLAAWQKGLTGYPIIDAGMRQLWKTGWMHNRVRMIVASFLVKHLGIHWREGARWFWETLVDADLANNSAGWQWVAGCGADAAPYFRIFNPILQGQKFDPAGDYVRAWVPELAKLPAAFIHKPWAAPESVLIEAGITLGYSYPHPLVDHDTARREALEAYATFKRTGGS
ncbi:deoxyribodipyrimidine photo-lyase [Saccharophagus sp. K07]|uniref:cryptochrome/photolyase family protein n=1 Tax=Saccharophagus sp. K07 TaxID=2283636 RepID=UPI001651F2FB|nr:deoxyribodipyrimidine photo-lyase [Saccharophagus sp. K07]MBC6903921.1 deoxyribodipyrimidine photo-lyase [Saccharophagus sp. K07]